MDDEDNEQKEDGNDSPSEEMEAIQPEGEIGLEDENF
jgi:hypothetical protein